MTIPRSLLVNVFIVFLVLMLSCEDREKLVGKYQVDGNQNLPSQTISLELMANGQGSWSIEEDNAFFKWEIRAKEIWLHTKSGGVIVGRIVGETIEINLPGVGEYYFKKVKR